MVYKIKFEKYRKINNLEIQFDKNVNIISGTNGTCKTSLLHIISNSMQEVNRRCDWIKDFNAINNIIYVNNYMNPKIETLTKGDKQYNDPAKDHKGPLYTVEYFDRTPLIFRKHNSTQDNRYAVKPQYKRGTQDSLPFCPVIYMGLSRLYPFGEYQNDTALENLKKNLPEKYLSEISAIYEKFTGIKISHIITQKMGDIKKRADFTTDKDGIDSNTISAGEDNLFIILTALISLKYYFESIESNHLVESVLLIDELDATLHPSFQIKLLEIFNNFSNKYKIQIIFTTHSISLLESALKMKYNVIYLIDNITSVINMKEPDIYKIKMYLSSVIKDDIYLDKFIPIFTEDDEARTFLNLIFDYFIAKVDNNFKNIRSFFHFVEANIGSDNLINIFNDSYLLRVTMRSICILDADKKSSKNLSNLIITLPGNSSPEELIMNYSKVLFENDSDFWGNETIINLGYGKIHYRDNILPDIENIDKKIEQLRESEDSTKGVRRSENKRIFIKHKRFFSLLFKHWLNSPDNQDDIRKFYIELQTLFFKVAEFHGINPKEWKIL